MYNALRFIVYFTAYNIFKYIQNNTGWEQERKL